ncbi:M56 family metallopeptidase [Nocardiopsis coralliicola]
MVSAALLAAIAVGCFAAAARLRRADWPSRGPYVAVIAWQALGLAWGVSTIGALLAFGLQAYGVGVLHGISALWSDAAANGLRLTGAAESPFGPVQITAILVAVGLTLLLFCCLMVSFAHVVRTRRRHHDLLQLVGRDDPGVPGARILDHPTAAAYCLPGVLRSEVVVSAGALQVLDERELAAVIAHEHAHLRQRHDLVLLPFSSLKRAFPRVRIMESYYRTVSLLIEMCADDQARRERSPKELATALMRVGASRIEAPAGTLAATAEHADVVARVNRLLRPGRALTRGQSAGVLAAAALLMSATTTLWHLPM